MSDNDCPSLTRRVTIFPHINNFSDTQYLFKVHKHCLLNYTVEQSLHHYAGRIILTIISQIPTDQIVMGIGIALLSAWGLSSGRWLLVNSKKGERLVNWLGEQKAIWVLRSIFALGFLFGLLLATNIIQPVQW